MKLLLTPTGITKKPFEIRSLRREELEYAFTKVKRILNTKAGRNLSDIKKGFARKPSYMIGCFAKNKFCGAVFAFDQGKKVFVGELAVDEKYRGKAIGRSLMEELERRAKADHKRLIYFGARGPAERFYQRLGYSPLLFLQIHKKDAPRDLSSRLRSYQIRDIRKRREKEGMDFKVTINVNGLDKALQKKAKKYLNAYSSIFLFEKVI